MDINGLRSIYGFIKEIGTDLKAQKKIDSVSSRILSIFETHGVHRNQINRFMGYDLSIADYQSSESFLPHITDEMITAISSKFSIRQQWIECASSQCHDWYSFYKSPSSYKKFLEEQLRGSDKNDIDLFLLNSKQKNGQ